MKLNLNLDEIMLEAGFSTARNQVFSRNIHRKYVNPRIVEECLNTLDIFRGLFEGMPHQKNRVIRDVSKALEVHQY